MKLVCFRRSDEERLGLLAGAAWAAAKRLIPVIRKIGRLDEK